MIQKITSIDRVTAIYDDELNSYAGLKISSDLGAITVWCDPDWDEIKWENKDIQIDGIENEIFSEQASVLWVWVFTNQQKYQDGIRFELRTEDDEEFILEAISIASGLAIYKPRKISEPAH